MSGIDPGRAGRAVPVGAVAVPSTWMNLTGLLLVEPTSAPPPDPASWWDYTLSSVYFLGSLAAIAAAFIALVGFRPKLREWREGLAIRMFARRWASPRRHHLLYKMGHWLLPREWQMTEEGKRAWDDEFDAAIAEHNRRNRLRHRHRESKRERRALSRKRCADCGARCDAMGTLYEDGSAVCGECGLQRRAAATGTRWERYETDRGFGFRRVAIEPTPSDRQPDDLDKP